MPSVTVIQADITTLSVDAIVNAANESLLGGGGVDGAIHRAAGPELLAECRSLKGCRTGETKITKGYRLPANYVLHTVGPVYSGGQHGEEELLRGCYQSALALAVVHDVRSIAFPSISTGIYGYPFRAACGIALSAIDDFFRAAQADTHPCTIEEVLLVCFSDVDFQTYLQIQNDFQSKK